ncbi:MAG: prenyltransferase/squalene oxidase repeat-containing protein [Planctomycetota bacterium]
MKTARKAWMAAAAAALWFAGAGIAAEGESGASTLPETLNQQAVDAIERAVKFLVLAQRPDGGWNSDGGGYGTYPTTMTALAGIALLAHGSTPTKGPEAAAVANCTDWILRNQTPQGLYASAGENREMRSMYGHGFSMLFLSQVYGLEGSSALGKRIHDSLLKAVDLSARSQSRPGGWNYGPDPSGDEGSVTVTQVHALRAVANAGIRVPKAVLDKCVQYLEGAQCPDGGIAYKFGMGGGSRPPISAAGLVSLLYAGRYDSPATRRLTAYVEKTFLKGGGMGRAGAFSGHHFYTHYYLGQSMWLSGDRLWRNYFLGEGGREGARSMFLKSQAVNGSWSGECGPVYATAMAVTVLQLPFNYLPIYQR